MDDIEDVETVRKALVLYENLTAWPGQATAAAGTHKQAMSAIRSLTNLEARLRTAEDENAALIEGAANVGMERDMANAENERLRSALKGVDRTLPVGVQWAHGLD